MTWNGDIARIVEARCVRCHAADGRGPMPLTSWEEARPWARAMKEEVLTRRMPKWHAAHGYGDFRNDPSLSSFEIALIVAWADGGAPKGTPGSVASGSVASGFSRMPQSPGTPVTARTRTLRCGTTAVSGQLLAIQPVLQKGASVRISAQLPDGRREILAWIRNFDPDFVETYELRTPLDLPRGSTLHTDADGACRVAITLASTHP